MFRIIAADGLVGIAFILVWYLLFVRYNRRKALQVLHGIREVFGGQAQVIGVRWIDASHFAAKLRVVSTLFQHATVQVRMQPRQFPFYWLWSRLRKHQETMTFEADLECPPAFNLEVHNHRWCGHTRKFPRDLRRLALDQCGPFVLTTRNDWQREITAMMSALVASRDCDFLTVNFRRISPHFSATVPLGSIANGSESEAEIFEVLRDLASCAQASKF